MSLLLDKAGRHFSKSKSRTLGTPTLEEYAAITSRRSRDYIRALPIRRRKPLASLMPNATPAALDFLSRTLASSLPLIRSGAFQDIHFFPRDPDV